jgi:large subunit ribosomal protein L23
MNYKIKPVLTEKSMAEAAQGRYTFLVPTNLNKFQIKEVIGSIYSVNPKIVKTINYKKGKKRNARGKIVKITPKKKAIVTLSDKEKIAIFGEKK